MASRYGHLDVLVNNAGINYETSETAENADIDGTVVETISTNLLGAWRVCQAFLPLLRKSKAARIVNGHQSLDRGSTWALVRLHIKSPRLP